MKKTLKRRLLLIAALLAAIAFVVKFGLPQVLRGYIRTGIGDCKRIPILCMTPEEITPGFVADQDYIRELMPLEFPNTRVSVPRGFKVVQELVARPFYKKKRLGRNHDAVIYLIHQPPGFFLKLFPQAGKIGMRNNYEFFRAVMHSTEPGIRNVDDAMFVILKSIFTPDLGNQRTMKMIQFRSGGRDYFINYNLSGPAYLFDCCVLTPEGDFFKAYIKDTLATLDLEKVFSILTTLTPAQT
ncbi:MAG: hypothetical protein WC478_02380 [Candidatus Omnitrophota bacterium]